LKKKLNVQRSSNQESEYKKNSVFLKNIKLFYGQNEKKVVFLKLGAPIKREHHFEAEAQ